MAETSGGKTWMMLLSAIGFGLVAAVLSVLYLKSREAAILESLLGEEEVIVSIVVPNKDLLKGTRLSEDQLSLLDMPEKYVSDATLRPVNYETYLGRFMINGVSAGRPLLATDIETKFPRDFSDLINVGNRAITIQVDEINSLSGMIRPGNHVDIYTMIQAKVAGFNPAAALASDLPDGLANAALAAAGLPEGTEIPDQLKQLVSVQEKPKDVILPVLQDVRVLATGREAYDAYLDQYNLPQFRVEDSFSAITLNVSPRQVGLLSLAADKGDLVAVLRNRDDRGLADFEGITPFDLVKEAARLKKLADQKKAAAAAGLTINENGDYVDANGNIIAKEDLIFNADGSVTTKQALMEAAGYTLNENGEYVDADGNVVNPDDIKILANGTIMTKDGKILSGPDVRVNKHGCLIAADGTVMTESGKILSGVFVDEDDNVIGPDGKIMTDCDLTVADDGTVRDKNGNVIAGITGSSYPPEYDESGFEDALNALLNQRINLIIGGSSKDGKAKNVDLPVEPVAAPLENSPADAGGEYLEQ
jgi:pilus assembly protein CpaB